MTPCFFCDVLLGKKTQSGLITDLDLGKFVACFDDNPVTPGHTIMFPKRHAQFMKDLTRAESSSLVAEVVKLKDYLGRADLVTMYRGMVGRVAGTKSEAYATKALQAVTKYDRPPDAFNDGLNDGPAAGQTVPHFHWHVMPRWVGDVEDPRGGIRHMFAGMGNYHEGVKRD